MARKTQNSSQSLPSATAQTLHANRSPPSRISSRTNKNASHIPQTATAKYNPQQSTAGGEGDAADGQRSTDDGIGIDTAEAEPGKPAVIAPSVRPSIEGSEQAGLVTDNADQTSAASIAQQNQENGYNSDDEDYAAVNDISDSSDDEPGVEALTKRIGNRNGDAHPSTNFLHWYEHEQKIQGMLGEDESFFDQHLEASDLDLTLSVGDDINFHTVWEGLPDAPVEPQTPTSLPLPSPRRVHFESKSSNGSDGSSVGADESDEDDVAAENSATARSWVDLENSDASSGYESERGTTDEEEPPVSASELIKPPHLLRRSSPSLLNPSPANHSFGPSSSEQGFRVPSLPASRRRGGPKLGTFKTSSSRSFAIVNQTCNALLIHHATRPSSTPTPRPSRQHSRVGSIKSNSAPQTPSVSHATLSLAQDLSETEFSDAVASQISADPVLSAGPDFITSAGFPQTPSRAPRTTVPQMQPSSVWFPQDSFDVTSVLSGRANGLQAQFHDLPQEEDGAFAYEDMVDIPEDESSEDGGSIMTISSPLSDTFAVCATSPSGQAAHKSSPSSASSNLGVDLFGGVDITGWTNSTNQRPHSRQPPKRPRHGLSLSGNALKGPKHSSSSSHPAKKRKISEVHGRKTPPMPSLKRRLTAGHR